MTKNPAWCSVIAASALGLCACASQGAQNQADPTIPAVGLDCGALEGAGAQRPFAGGPGVSVGRLRASDLSTYDHEATGPTADLVGIRYSVAATPGSSKTWLERRVLCYRATRATASVPDPLLVSDTTVSVQAAGGRYLVDVTSHDPTVAREVLLAAGL